MAVSVGGWRWLVLGAGDEFQSPVPRCEALVLMGVAVGAEVEISDGPSPPDTEWRSVGSGRVARVAQSLMCGGSGDAAITL